MAETATNGGLKAHLGSLSYILMMGVLGSIKTERNR